MLEDDETMTDESFENINIFHSSKVIEKKQSKTENEIDKDFSSSSQNFNFKINNEFLLNKDNLNRTKKIFIELTKELKKYNHFNEVETQEIILGSFTPFNFDCLYVTKKKYINFFSRKISLKKFLYLSQKKIKTKKEFQLGIEKKKKIQKM